VRGERVSGEKNDFCHPEQPPIFVIPNNRAAGGGICLCFTLEQKQIPPQASPSFGITISGFAFIRDDKFCYVLVRDDKDWVIPTDFSTIQPCHPEQPRSGWRDLLVLHSRTKADPSSGFAFIRDDNFRLRLRSG
jgi:hypothetical protein